HLVAVGVGIELVAVGVLGGFGRLAVLALAALIIALLILRVLALALVLGVVLAALGLLLVVLAFLALAVRALLRQVERLEQVAQLAAERLLVVGELIHTRKRAAGALLDPRTPQVDHGFRRLGRGGAGQTLAHDQRQRILERRIAALSDLGVA